MTTPGRRDHTGLSKVYFTTQVVIKEREREREREREEKENPSYVIEGQKYLGSGCVPLNPGRQSKEKTR